MLSNIHLTNNYSISDSASYAHYVFNAFDQDHSGSISFEEFVMGLSLLARGSLHDKLQWAFNLYDVNGKKGASQLCIHIQPIMAK